MNSWMVGKSQQIEMKIEKTTIKKMNRNRKWPIALVSLPRSNCYTNRKFTFTIDAINIFWQMIASHKSYSYSRTANKQH